MEIKATLQKPYTEEERENFIVEYNHNQGLVIEETEDELQALGYTEEELAQFERERIAKLKLTKREVFLGIYKAKQISPEQIRAMITDTEALIEFDYANDYYRGNPLINSVGEALGFTTEQLDRFFETKDYTELLPKVEEVTEESVGE